MLLLIKTHPQKTDPANRDNVARFLFEQVRDTYDETSSCGDAYLADPDDSDGFAKGIGFIDGAETPNVIIDMARNWNRDIEKRFQQALETVNAHVTENPTPNILHYRPWLTCPRPYIYELKKAAMALDNSFYDFAERALLIDDHNIFTTVLKPEELADIEANPQNYVSITVEPK